MPRFTESQREQAFGLLSVGSSKRQVAGRFGCTRATIYRLEQRYEETGRTRDRYRSGRPRVTTARQDRRIRLQHLRNRFRTAVMTASETQAFTINESPVKRSLIASENMEFALADQLLVSCTTLADVEIVLTGEVYIVKEHGDIATGHEWYSATSRGFNCIVQTVVSAYIGALENVTLDIVFGKLIALVAAP